MRFNALAQVGGVNSFENFARSWQRAVAFHEITPTRASFAVAEDDARPDLERSDSDRTPIQHRSLLRQEIERYGRPSESAVQDLQENDQLTRVSTSQSQVVGSPSRDIFSHATHLASPFSSSYGGTYGSLSAHTVDSGREMAARLFLDQQATGTQPPDKDMEPMLLRRVEEEGGHVSLEAIGQSTVYQTILNSTNVLIGVGLLSLPLGIKYAGWLVGLLFLTASAIVTGYTAKLLAKCLDVDRNLITFSDIGYVAFGPRAQILIGVLFTLELTAACVALVVLFADSLNLLIPGWGILEFKIVCGIIMIPLSFVPLRFLGYTSSLGIISCFASLSPAKLYSPVLIF
jgi:solute carrier family 32 (vesicular inhibitory amino acid transporter)